MATIKFVEIYYGPSYSFHTYSHKPQKLRGLTDRLRQLGYRVNLIPVHYINHCQIVLCGSEVYRCHIQNLCFNRAWSEDKVCKKILNVVQRYTKWFDNARTYMWIASLIEEQIFNRIKLKTLGPKQHWLRDAINFSTSFGVCECLQNQLEAFEAKNKSQKISKLKTRHETK